MTNTLNSGEAERAMGGTRRTPGAAVAALTEAIEVLRALWTPGRGVRLPGSHYRLAGARPGPFPPRPIGIWLGAYRPRMLELTGRVADGWLPSEGYAPPGELAAMNRIIDDAAVAAGRAPGEIRRLYNISPPADVTRLADLALAEGVSGFVLPAASGDSVARFAAEVAPGVRELVAKERGR